MQHLPGNLFILSAPSGAGKSSLIHALLGQHQDMQLSVSHTTRAPRPGEVDGVHYHFVSVEAFKALIADNNFLEWAEVFGNYYGTSRTAIEQVLALGRDVFLDIDWQGARQIKSQVPSVLSIFILPPSVAELEKRLNQRGQDNQEIIAKRMLQAKSEISHVTEYDYVLVNDDFQQCLNELQQVVLSQRLTLQKQQQRQQALLTDLLAN
ncbi:MAG: guanylate kinase [Gammaproteobacteria bacterium]|jgi:guanylate kinase|nr:guanylate kinase [Gammaproteobacteria bacterium]MBU2279737.1 guanylate kinase [Gammaproteobacteria bacterium]